jgi:single-strand DNA-binding protein
MYGLNRVQLIGHLGQDPELKYSTSGTAICNFSLATNESYKDQNGQLVERTEWHRLVVYRKLAELLAEHLKKGSKVYIEGKLQTRSWDDKDGNKRYTTEVVVDDFVFLDSKGGRQSQGGRPAPSAPDQTSTPAEEAGPDLPF